MLERLSILPVISLFWGLCSFYANAMVEWVYLKAPVSSGPTVVEYSSFQCSSCYAFSQTLGVDQEIRRTLPKNEKMETYDVNLFGSLGHEQTWAWSRAKIKNVKESVEKAFFTATMVEKNINTLEDIRRLFMDATGMSREEYDWRIKSKAVHGMEAKQESLLRRENKVAGTFSDYVLGKYHINNRAFGSPTVEAFNGRYADTIHKLREDNDSVTDFVMGMQVNF
ncbi:DsbA family protein [Escherichia albertii]|uniref:DsbA family protein n=2 Tax=Escherichia albertii TaxID=208962 RepID=UPI000B036510|nr:DsbA family protein [Escherichia albertii]